jgi:hypothetical protein
MTRNADNNDDDVVAIKASARARELRVDNKPRTDVSTRGRGRVITRREGLPARGADEGETYANVGVSVEIVSGIPDPDAEAGGDSED